MSPKLAGIEGFAFQHGDAGKEINTLCVFANYHQILRKFFRKATEVPADYLPVGNVDWLTACLGRHIAPDYYPDFLAAHLHRHVWLATKWPLGASVFVKPADRYKRFTGFVTRGTWKGSKRGPLWCSDVVTFTNEWRWYVANSQVFAKHWYAGDDVNTPDCPAFEVDFPADYCGAVDFGQMPDGRLALVEAQHPFACGWYGSLNEGAIYAEWLAAGWRSLTATASPRPPTAPGAH